MLPLRAGSAYRPCEAGPPLSLARHDLTQVEAGVPGSDDAPKEERAADEEEDTNAEFFVRVP